MTVGTPHSHRSIVARLVALVLVAIVVTVAVLRAKPPHTLTIESGPAGGSYYLDAQAYQKILATRGIKLRIQQRPNSLEIVRDVADPHSGIDVGFIAQDVSVAPDAPLFSVGQIELQPLFIFSSAALGRRTVLDDLRGRRIVMPPSDSATSDAALRVFNLYDITPDNTTFSYKPLTEAVTALQAGQFDAGVFMLAPENSAIRSLAADSSLHLVPIPETKAISNHLPFLRPVLLPRGIYDIADAIPPSSTPLIAAPVGIVIRAGLHPYLIYSLLDAMTKTHHGPTFLSEAGDFPTLSGSQLTVHPLAAQYYASGIPWTYRELPPWLASAIDRYQVGIFGVLLIVGLAALAIWLADVCVTLVTALVALASGRRASPVANAKAPDPTG